MKYPVAVWADNDGFSAEVPDLPGVITEANSIEELSENIEEASLGWMEAELDEGRNIPKPTSVETHMQNPAYQNCIWLLIEINLNKLSDKVERLNICLPSRVIRRLDSLAKKSGESRSGYLAKIIYGLAP